MLVLMEAARLAFLSAGVLSLVATAFLLVPLLILLFPPLADIGDELRRTHRRLGSSRQDVGGPQAQTQDLCSPQAGRTARIHSLHVYPVKSCRGIQLSHSAVMPKGLEYDRLYTFARRRPRQPAATAAAAAAAAAQDPISGPPGPDRANRDGNGDEDGDGRHQDPEWEIATLRQLPLLANVQVDLWLPDDNKTEGGSGSGRGKGRGTGRGTRGQGSSTPGGLVVITFPLGRAGADAGFARGLVQTAAARLGRGSSAVPRCGHIVLPLDFPSPVEIERKGYRYENVQFFRKTVGALNMAREVPPELAAYLGVKGPMALFRMDPARRRGVYGNAPRKEVVGFQPVVDFQDQYPLHLLSLSSVQALEAKIHKDDNIQSLDPRRFRPNIIVSGLPEYDEDNWRIIQAKPAMPGGPRASLSFDVSCRTVRCTLPNVDPATGIRHKLEPDHSLRKHREIDEGAPKKGCFGMQLCPVLGDTEKGVLKVGMEIHVVQRGPHFAL